MNTYSLYSRAALIFASLLVFAGITPLEAEEAGEAPEVIRGNYRTDSQTPYVHNIPIYDEDGSIVKHQSSVDANPISQAQTCGKCHNIEVINSGWHFNATDPNVNPGRKSEPWIYTDPATRTVIPMSFRDWEGLAHPADVGMSRWDFTLHFGAHFPGAGPGLPPPPKEGEEVEGRWDITGALENDCMICHTANNSQYDPNQRYQQLEKENFKWAPSVAMGLAKVKGEASSVSDDYDPELGEFEDLLGGGIPGGDEGGSPPTIEYDQRKFDADGNVLFDIVADTPNERCLYCHTNHGVDPNLPVHFQQDIDIHLRAGMSCNDCHRHGLDHAVTRGYEGEHKDRPMHHAGTLTCVACHIEDAVPEDVLGIGGRLGAPIAKHEGLPLIHLETMECTACHSGFWPQEETVTMQTSKAHMLGIALEDRRPDDKPYVIETVFARPMKDGKPDPYAKIAPHRQVWPTYWARMSGDTIEHLPLELVEETLTDLLKVSSEEAHHLPSHGWKKIEPTQLAEALGLLAPKVNAIEPANESDAATDGEGAEDAGEWFPVYVDAGRVYHVNDDGEVEAFDHTAAEPYAWPYAHDVRGAGQSLGSRGCADCHSKDAPVYFGKVLSEATISSPVLGADTLHTEVTMHELHDVGSRHKLVATAAKLLIIVTMVLLIAHMIAETIRRYVFPPKMNIEDTKEGS